MNNHTNNILNQIPYEGKLTIKLKGKDGKLRTLKGKNRALVPMTALFARMIAGYNLDNYIPIGVDITDGTGQSILKVFAPLTGKHIETVGDGDSESKPYEAILVSTIYSEYLNNPNVTIDSSYKFHLINNLGQHLNEVSIDTSNSESNGAVSPEILPGQSLILEWHIRILNQ